MQRVIAKIPPTSERATNVGNHSCHRRHGEDQCPWAHGGGCLLSPQVLRLFVVHLRKTSKDFIFGQFCRGYNLQGTLILAFRTTKVPEDYAYKITRLEKCPLTSFIHFIIEERGSQSGSLLLAFPGSGFHLEMQLPLLL